MNEPQISTPADSGLTSLSMLERVRASDGEAWRRLVHLYSPLIYSWCRNSELGNEDAADVLQEVWSAVAAHVNRFHRTTDAGTFRGWLWTITRNKLRDYYRANAGKAAGVGGSSAQQQLATIPEDEPPTPAGDNDNLMHRALEMIRGDFEPQTWRAFWRTAVDGWIAADAGAELKLSVDAVYQAKSRVLRRLREELRGLVD